MLQTLAQFSPKHLDQNQSQPDLSNQGLRSEPSGVSRSDNGSPLKQDWSSSSSESSSWPRRSTSLKAKHHTVRYENAQPSAQGRAKLNEEDVPFTPAWSEKPVEKPVEKTTSALRKKQYRNTFKLEGCAFISCCLIRRILTQPMVDTGIPYFLVILLRPTQHIHPFLSLQGRITGLLPLHGL